MGGRQTYISRADTPLRRLTLALLVASAWAPACTPLGQPREGLDETQLPAYVRADYALFAQRCSKCHSLARSLLSNITDDEYWKEYVERMRRQTGSGISPADEEPILRFLHYYSVEAKRRQNGGG